MVYFSFSTPDIGSSANATATFPGLQPGSETKIIQPGPNLIVIRLPRITTVPPPTPPGPVTTTGPPRGKPLFSQISSHIHFTLEPIIHNPYPYPYMHIGLSDK